MEVELKRLFRKVGFRFDSMAAWLMCQEFKVDLDSMDKIPQDDYLPSWVWSAHRSYSMDRYKKPMSYDKMKVFIAKMRKSEWDKIIQAMIATRAPESTDKKKVPTGMNSSSRDGERG